MILFVKRILYCFFLSFLNFNFCSGKKCLTTKISDVENCQICLPTYYQIDFFETLNYRLIEFPEKDCLLKISQKNRRNILIQNRECENCNGFDAKYYKFVLALEEESRIALQLFFYFFFLLIFILVTQKMRLIFIFNQDIILYF